MKAKINVLDETFSLDQGKMIPLEHTNYSITITDFKDPQEAEIILSKINEMIRNWQTKRRVF